MPRLFSLLIVLVIYFSPVQAQISSEQFLIHYSGTPMGSAANAADFAHARVKIQGQVLYENRYLLKALAVKSIAFGGVWGFKSWNAAYRQQGTFHYQSHQFRLNYSTRLHPQFRMGANLYLRCVQQSNSEDNKWLAYPELGFQYTVDEVNKIFSGVEYVPSKTISHYAAAIYYERKLEERLLLVAGVSSSRNQTFFGSLALRLIPHINHVFSLELNNGHQPVYFNYRYRINKIQLHFGFWYHNQLPVSNQLSVNYHFLEDPSVKTKNSAQQ